MRRQQFAHVGPQGLRVAGDVEDVLEAFGEFQRCRVEAAAGRVDEEGAEAVAGEVDVF